MGNQVQLNNRFQLREHPDKSPLVDASFNKTHAFIYPGDELVLINEVNFPIDANVASMSQIVFQNAKTSIIAEKPNVFSRVFSNIFAATRSFDLDSFALAFNKTNCPVVPWGAGGVDGYAPNMNYQVDRNWKLPSGAFKRQVNYFTEYTASGSANPIQVEITHSSGTGTIMCYDNTTGFVFGCANWTTNIATTLNRLATSINTNTNLGTLFGGYSFNNVAGYTAAVVSGVAIKITPPSHIAFINQIAFIGDSSGAFGGINVSTYGGTITYLRFSGGVTAAWQYWFYFPVLFRWEYWKILAAADPDFYSFIAATLAVPEGQNQFWENYSIPPKWLIKSHLELNTLVNGAATTFISEYSLSNEANEINTYDSNADYTNKSIKTCAIGGTPSNTPIAPVFGYQDTAVYAYFTKVASWASGEQANLVGFMWIEPYQAGGEPVRVVASSIFPIPSSSWFVDMFQQIDTNNDLGLVTNSGESIVTNNSGNGVLVTFDSTNIQNVILLSQLDYNKIQAAFPGVTTFTIYARLYNGTKIVASASTTIGTLNVTGSQYVANAATGQSYVVAGIPAGYTLQSVITPSGWSITSTGAISAGSQTFAMTVGLNSGTIIFTYVNGGITISCQVDVYVGATKQGEEIQQALTLVRTNPVMPQGTTFALSPVGSTCEYDLPVFADGTGNPITNDMSDFYYYADGGVTAISIAIQKNSSCGTGAWTTQATFADNTYGKFFAFGKAPDFSGTNFIDDYGKRYTGIQMQWSAILAAFGTGYYRIKVSYTSIFSTTAVLYSPSNYCLATYATYLSNQTVRIETTHSGLYGAGIEDSENQIDYYTGWDSQIRIPAIFWYKSSSYTKEFNEYGDLNFNIKLPIINEQVPKFRIDVKPAPGWIDFYLATNVLQADYIYITDYNVRNRHLLQRIPVINDADFTPKDDFWFNDLAPSELNFIYAQNNLRKRND